MYHVPGVATKMWKAHAHRLATVTTTSKVHTLDGAHLCNWGEHCIVLKQ